MKKSSIIPYSKIKKIIIIISLSLGTIFLVIGASILFRNLYIKNNYIKTDAQIRESYDNDDETVYYVSYDITVNNKRYHSDYLKITNAPFISGDTITIYINPLTGKAGYNSYTGVIVLSILAFVTLTFGITLLIVVRREFRKIKYYIVCGNKIKAHITGFEENQMVEIANKHPLKICCEYYDEFNDQTYHFKSKDVLIKAQEKLIGLDIIVYVIPNTNYSDYYVDINKIDFCQEEL